MERLVVCQGTAQLVTAVSALRAHAKRAEANTEETPSRNHLLICGLAVPERQANEFARVIERMVALLHPFASISRLDDGTLEQLIEAAQRGASARAVADRLKRVTRVEKVDEVASMQ